MLKRFFILLAVLTAFLVWGGSYSANAAQPFSRETPVVRAVRLAGPSVVNINTRQVISGRRSPFHSFQGDEFFDRFFQDFFEPYGPREYARTSLGSGVIIDGKKGLILTNEHVVSRATEIKVTLVDETEYTAKLVGSDPDSDLAVLQIKANKTLPSLKMGDSSDLMIGETVIAIGNPFGLTHTVTTGVISATGRSLKSGGRIYRDFIQTDASINPGNSGGPLLNINGSLIGINSAIYDRAEGIGFAIPINKAKRIVRDLISYGEVKPAWLGLSLQSVDERLAHYFKIQSGRGVLVTEVDPDGPAASSNLQPGDVIQKIGRQAVASVDDYEDLLRSYTPGTKIQLEVLYRGKTRRVSIRTASYPEKKAVALGWNRYGLSVSTKKTKTGALVINKVRSGSPAGNIGIRRGDLLLRINEISIESPEAYLKAMTRYRLRQGLTIIIQRGRVAYRVTLTP